MRFELHSTLEHINKILENVGILIMVFLGLLAVLQVSSRYFLSGYLPFSTVWTEEIIRFFIIIMTMIGVPYAMWTGEHISIRPLIELLPRTHFKILVITSNILVIVMSVIVAISGLIVAHRNIERTLITVSWIRVGYGHIVISTMFMITAIYVIYMTYCIIFDIELAGNADITGDFVDE